MHFTSVTVLFLSPSFSPLKNAALEMKLQQMVIIIHLLLRQEIIRQCPRVKFIDSRLHCLTLTAIPVVLPKSNLICLSGHSLLRICVTSSLIVVDRRRWSISTTTYSAAGASTVKHEGVHGTSVKLLLLLLQNLTAWQCTPTNWTYLRHYLEHRSVHSFIMPTSRPTSYATGPAFLFVTFPAAAPTMLFVTFFSLL